MNQKRTGIIISYLNLLLGMVVNVFLTPFLISTLGDVDYSLYKVMQSLAGPLSMFNLGISTIVARSVVRHNNVIDYSEKDKQNTMALALLASCIMSVFVIVAGLFVYQFIPEFYGDKYTDTEVDTGGKLFVIFLISTVLHMLTDAFSGCIVGHERFVVNSSIPLIKTVLKILLLVVLLKSGMGVVAVVTVDLVLAMVVFLFTAGYAVLVLREIPKLYCFDKKQIIEILSFGAAILLQAFVNQINNNVDTVILGGTINEKSIITMYSSALAVYAIYNSMISVITNFFLPKATKLVSQSASGKELTDFVIPPGRFQAIVAVGCICCFALFGKNFITIWIGEKYLNAYWVILMLIVPVTIPLVENAVISILDASMKRTFRSVVLVIMAILNVIVSIILVDFIGFWGVALGTVLSLVVGHGILMNIYYAKTFNMEIVRMFFSIFKGILPAGIAASLLCVPLSLFLNNTFFLFLLKCVSFVLLYGIFLWLFGINDDEKKSLKKIFEKRQH